MGGGSVAGRRPRRWPSRNPSDAPSLSDATSRGRHAALLIAISTVLLPFARLSGQPPPRPLRAGGLHRTPGYRGAPKALRARAEPRRMPQMAGERTRLAGTERIQRVCHGTKAWFSSNDIECASNTQHHAVTVIVQHLARVFLSFHKEGIYIHSTT